MSKHIIVVGGGAAGMMAAIATAKVGHTVTLLEKNEKLGKKIYITGKGRCNITNAGDMEALFGHIVTNQKFLYSSFYSFNNFDMIDLLEAAGCKTKIERGNRVFPESDKSSDVIGTLIRILNREGVTVKLYTEVKSLLIEKEECKGVVLANGAKLSADHVIVATGGLSYQTTGSTGDGYRFAEKAGHTVTALRPALVPFVTKEDWVKELQGLSLRNVNVQILAGKKVLYEEFGEMLFTHFGVSGPAILSGSSIVAKRLEKESLTLSIDLKPALSEKQLDDRILRDFEEFVNKQFKNALGRLFPSKIVPVVIAKTGISPEKQINEITKEERERLIHVTKHFTLTLTGTRAYNEAIITQGGVSVKEINPTTMESRLIKNLSFAGEVLDIDAYTGGYNLQVAWSTGWAAGSHI